MPDFWIEITETLSTVIRCQAASSEEAREKVRQRYANSEIVLDADNLVLTEFRIENQKEVHHA